MPLAGGAVVALATAQSNASNVLLAGNAVFWADLGGSIETVAATGGAPAAIALAIDDSYAYLSLDDGQSSTIARVPLGGGTVETLAATPELAGAMVVDATSLYWIGMNTGAIRKLSPK